VSGGDASRPLASIRADRVVMRPVRWLDRPFLQASAFELVTGKKGVGKGTWLARVAAAMTQGAYGKPRNVLWIATEDSAGVDIKPRLLAAGADLSRVEIATEHFVLPAELHRVQRKAEEIGDVGLIVIDPLSNHMGGKDTNADDQVRFAIAGLNRMADDLDCLILGVRHLGKTVRDGALGGVLGSTAWVDLPRAVLAFAVDDEDEMVFYVQVVAGNRSGRSAAQAYRIELRDVEDEGQRLQEITYAVALGESPKNVDDLLAAPRRESKSAGARDLILDILESQPGAEMESDALDARVATETGLSAKTVRNQRAELKHAGLIRSVPEKGDDGAVARWKVVRTGAPRG
jgi:hypothetical protein